MRLWFDVDGPALVPDGSEMRQRPTVVLVHGGPGGWDHSYFKPDFAPLTERAQVVYLDLRGHGRSERGDPAAWSFEACADDLRAFCDAIGIIRPIVFGHSMGGPIVLLYGARHPGHAAGLIVQSGFARFDIPRLIEGFRRVAGDEVADIAGRDFRGDPVTDDESARVSAAFGPRVPDDDQRARAAKNLELNSYGMELTRRTDIVDQLRRIKSPTLVCVGELDPVTPVTAAQEIVDALPAGIAQLEASPGRATGRGRTLRTYSGQSSSSSSTTPAAVAPPRQRTGDGQGLTSALWRREVEPRVNEADLAALLREHASRHSVPGAAVGILRDGAAATAYHGVANISTGDQVTPETQFSVGSLTKPMVATVIARLAEAGRLSLDDPVGAHVPELRGGGWAERATLRDLLANRSRLPLRAALEFGFDAHTGTDDGALSRLVEEVGAAGPPIDFWSYTNVGWCLLGRVIETATGLTWEDAMRRHLFGGAGMRGTAFATEPEFAPRAVGHELMPNGPSPVAPVAARAYGPAGTNVVSTVTDLLRFAALHLEDVSLAPLRDVHAEVSIYGWLDAWCLGWARFDWDGGPVWGWDGLIDGERSFLRILPDRQAAIALVTNGSTGRAMYRALFADLMGSLFGIRVRPLQLDVSPNAADDLSRFAGVYAWPDRQVKVTATAGRLFIKTERRETEALPLNGRTFVVDALDPDNPTVTFGQFDAAGRPRVLYLMLWGLPRVDEWTGNELT